MKIILASASPRRKELLEQIGITFDIISAKGEEKTESTVPKDQVEELAVQKATEVASACKSDSVIIGADTLVAYGNTVLGKPEDKKDAFHMLEMLQGHTHQVYTGVCVIRIDSEGTQSRQVFYEKTNVTMFPMNAGEIRNYIATEEPMDKAGAYAIQGVCAKYIKQIEGDYNNVVGLPIGRLWQECLSKID